jgi:hypothetical protein
MWSKFVSGHVYWSARDLKSSPIGNHHFLLIVFSNKNAAEFTEKIHNISFRSEEVSSKTTYFMTLGGFLEGGKLVFKANEKYDVKAVREWVDPEEHTSWWKPDLDLERHRLDPLKIDSDDTKSSTLIDRVIRAAKTYKKKGPVSYNLLDENCACWVNTLLKALGFSKSYRHERGEFFGVDWGEEDEIDINLFID